MGNCCSTQPANKNEPTSTGYIAGPSFDEVSIKCKDIQPEISATSSSSGIKVRALYDFQSLEKDDLSFEKGEFLEIESPLPETVDWIVAVKMKTRESGFIPSNYVVVYDTSPQSQEWWFPDNREKAAKRLLQPGNGPGTFLVRYGSGEKTYVLSVRGTDSSTGDPCVKHYKIQPKDDDSGFFISAKLTFPSILDIIDFYKDNSAGLCSKLTAACPSVAPVVPFKELEMTRDKVRLSKKLGAGCFGEVWKGLYLKAINVAVKTLKSGTMLPEEFLREAKTMHRLRHPRLVQLLGVVSNEEPYWIVTELMAHGALVDFLQAETGRSLEFYTLINMNSQIAEGMAYLESVNYVHRDLRTANILVDENYDVKVADFGLARILKDEVYAGGQDSKYPIKWTAPEAAEEKEFSVKSDVWSFGIVMYEIVTFGKIPYPGMKGYEVQCATAKGYRMEKPNNSKFEIPDSYYKMMLKCWHKDPNERPQFKSIRDFFITYFTKTEPRFKINNGPSNESYVDLELLPSTAGKG